MLDAFVKKNVRRVLVKRSQEHINDKNEDAVTSMVFTPLKFMSAENAFACLQAVAPRCLGEAANRKIRSLEIELWPLLKDPQGRYIEPDLQAKIEFEDGEPIILIGEMKWDSAVQPDQIARERRIAKNAKVLAIVKSAGKHDEDSLQCDELCTWTAVNGRISKLQSGRPSPTSPTQFWATLVSSFLKKAEQTIFQGFDHIDLTGVPPVGQKPIFF